MSTVRETGPPPVDTWPPRACDGTDTSVFFPGKQGGGTELGLVAAAKRICHRCEARAACRAYALPIADLRGIWGEMTEGQREKERTRLGLPGVRARGEKKQKEADR